MNEADFALRVLTAMITPSVLMLACASLLLSTSQRLNRSMERTRSVAARLREAECNREGAHPEELVMLRRQLELSSGRAILLQRAMTLLYIAMCFFIGTSMFIAVLEVTELQASAVLLVTALGGTALLFAASIVLMAETRLARRAVREEIRYTRDHTCET